MNTFQLYLAICCFTLVILIPNTFGRRASDDDERSLDFEIPHAQSNMFLRGADQDDSDDDDDDDATARQLQALQHRSQKDASYVDSKGRRCVKCKWNLLPCCEPNFCRKHFIRFNECVEVKGR